MNINLCDTGIAYTDAVDFSISYRNMNMDDNTLLRLFHVICADVQEKKLRFDKVKEKKSIDYLNLLLVKLAYEFSREEYDALLSEIERRDLNI